MTMVVIPCLKGASEIPITHFQALKQRSQKRLHHGSNLWSPSESKIEGNKDCLADMKTEKTLFTPKLQGLFLFADKPF
jgi:hypothetical protein